MDEAMGARFRLHRPPGVSVTSFSRQPIRFTRLRSETNEHGRTMPVPPDEAFAFHVVMRPMQSLELWRNGKRTFIPSARPGDIFVIDLTQDPVVSWHSPLDTVRFYITQETMDELAREKGFGPIGHLSAAPDGGNDLVMYGLAQAIAAALVEPSHRTTMFAEHVALAFYAHLGEAFGGKHQGEKHLGGLAPWQLRKACELMQEKLQDDPSIAELAAACRLSAGHFSRAFRQSAGVPPHQWLTRRRVERSRHLMRNPALPLAEIALACGFVDQSHFSRVFSREEGSSPGRWRRQIAS